MFGSFKHVGTAFVEPPLEEVPLGQAFGSNGVIHDRRGFIIEALPSVEDSLAEFRILIPNLAFRSGTQVGSEISVPLEHRSSECHVRSIWGFVQGTSFFAAVEGDKRSQDISLRW